MAVTKTECMALWDGFTNDQNARVMVLGAANRPAELDEAILRRLSQVIEIGRPDWNDREKIMKNERVEEDTIDLDHIGRLLVQICLSSTNKQHIFLSGVY